MKVINLYSFSVFLFIIKQLFALEIGDYIQIKDELPAIYGTVIDIKDDTITIRPHRFQGDFIKKSNEIEVIKTAQEIASIIPTDNQYSINLMWINSYNDSDNEHIFNTQETYDKIFKSASSWHKKNPLVDVGTMNKNELFDASTIMDLDTYGLVMARGGLNGLENSFQIWTNTQPEFLDAAKSIIIDRSIQQKIHVDKGGSLDYAMNNMEQKVYSNYFLCFHIIMA